MPKKNALVSAMVAGGLILAAGVASAADTPIDTSAATAGITLASTAVVGVIAALTTFQVGKWAVMQVKRLFGR